MSVATMNRTGLLVACVLLLACGRVDAQGPGFGGRGFTGSYGPGMENLIPARSGSGYLPSGGGFLPYTPGPGGGLGVQSRSPGMRPEASARSMAMPGSPGMTVGAASSRLAPPAPISGGGMGAMRSSRLINRAPMGTTTMPAGPRPPVGFYPFRVPPTLGGPATDAPGMSM